MVALAIVVSFLALGVSLWAHFLYRPPWRRPFEALEADFEDLRESVQSSLGRISRLKRSIQEGSIPATALEANDGKEGESGNAARPLSRSQLLAKVRKSNDYAAI